MVPARIQYSTQSSKAYSTWNLIWEMLTRKSKKKDSAKVPEVSSPRRFTFAARRRAFYPKWHVRSPPVRGAAACYPDDSWRTAVFLGGLSGAPSRGVEPPRRNRSVWTASSHLTLLLFSRNLLSVSGQPLLALTFFFFFFLYFAGLVVWTRERAFRDATGVHKYFFMLNTFPRRLKTAFVVIWSTSVVITTTLFQRVAYTEIWYLHIEIYGIVF